MMQTPLAKRHEYWNHFVEVWALKPSNAPSVTGPRLRKIKPAIMNDGHFWWDVVNRHGGLNVTPEQMAVQDFPQYEHCMGNFWGMMMQNLVEAGLVK